MGSFSKNSTKEGTKADHFYSPVSIPQWSQIIVHTVNYITVTTLIYSVGKQCIFLVHMYVYADVNVLFNSYAGVRCVCFKLKPPPVNRGMSDFCEGTIGGAIVWIRARSLSLSCQCIINNHKIFTISITHFTDISFFFCKKYFFFTSCSSLESLSTSTLFSDTWDSYMFNSDAILCMVSPQHIYILYRLNRQSDLHLFCLLL